MTTCLFKPHYPEVSYWRRFVQFPWTILQVRKVQVRHWSPMGLVHQLWKPSKRCLLLLRQQGACYFKYSKSHCCCCGIFKGFRSNTHFKIFLSDLKNDGVPSQVSLHKVVTNDSLQKVKLAKQPNGIFILQCLGHATWMLYDPLMVKNAEAALNLKLCYLCMGYPVHKFFGDSRLSSGHLLFRNRRERPSVARVLPQGCTLW